MDSSMEAISNPQPPPIQDELLAKQQTQLSNSDFRKLLLTTARSRKSQGDTTTKSAPSSRIRSDRPKSHSHKQHRRSNQHHHHQEKRKKKIEDGVVVAGEEVEKDGEGGSVSTTAPKYRDRARERREGKIASNMEGLDSVVTADGTAVSAETAGAADDEDREDDDHQNRIMRSTDYRTVAPTAAGASSYAAERRRAIEESKYFGGDMEHTHMVKGLDYVLLEKVRREIKNKEFEAERQLDDELDRPLDDLAHSTKLQDSIPERGGQINFKSRIAEGIFNSIFPKGKDVKVERNEYFQPGRMAYRVELEDEMAEFEVPATVIRSKADCLFPDQGSMPGSDFSANDIVINKLAQIFAYTRAGRRQAKKAKAAKRAGAVGDYDIQPTPQEPVKRKPIFDDAPTEYVATRRSHRDEENDDSHRSRHHREYSKDDKYRNSRNSVGGRRGDQNHQSTSSAGGAGGGSRYFDKPATEEAPLSAKNTLDATKDFIQQLAKKQTGKVVDEQASLDRLIKKTEISGYDECYPGFAESYDAMGDSDDETDFSKMDMGNKKGPVGRWDFETQEEYGDYMSNLEAMPRAAYQYGVKKPEGRKTRSRLGGGGQQNRKDDKAAVDRQLQQITSMINKRKQAAASEEEGGKRAKY